MQREFFNALFSFRYISRPISFLRKNGKIISQIGLTLLFVGLGIWFINHESGEIVDVKHVLVLAQWPWVLVGLGLTLFYILLQGQMYVFAFASIKKKVSLIDCTVLFIKRNLISVFLPAGGISSLAFFSGEIEQKGIRKGQIHFASSIYAFIGILSVVIVGIPAFIYAIFEGTVGAGEWYALVTIIALTAGLYLAYRSIMTRGFFFKAVVNMSPSSETLLVDLQSHKIDNKMFFLTILTSVVIEFVGVAHLYVAMVALSIAPSLFAAVMGYIISVIFLIVSPFMRGLGAIEVSMTYVLIRFGFGKVEAIAVTFLYRFFEFWMPLALGTLTFLSKIYKLLMRVFPALLLITLGIVNVVSVLTPAISSRLTLLKDFLPLPVIHTSNYLVMAAGLFSLLTAAFMLKSLRTAWWFAVFLCVVSFFGHIVKAIDLEEAAVALFVFGVLLFTKREYYVKTNPRLRNLGIQTSLLFTLAVFIYGVVGFYFLDAHHFNIDFSLLQSIRFTLQNYFLIGSEELISADSFAQHFLYSINVSGFLSISFLIYTFFQSYRASMDVSQEDLLAANELLALYGTSPLDYFKTYRDKMLFFSSSRKAFLAYRISGNFAVVLENPVAQSREQMILCIREFDKYCYEAGLKSVYYRVPEESLPIYHQLRKRDLFLGQEGVVDLTTFNVEGGDKKSMRKALKKINELGYRATVHRAPVKDGILQKIKAVSDDWLSHTEREEIIFSQGMFNWSELKQQTILMVEDKEEKVIAFVNIIPDYVKGEATYDLIRKTKDATNGVMDFVLVELFKYLKSEGFVAVNLGFAPMSGLNDPHTFKEKSMKFAYEKIKSFSQYKGLRDYKEKFDPKWSNKYLVYQNDYDLLQMPTVLTNVIKP